MPRGWFAEAFGSAVADIRSKLIDEAWFGRRINEPRGPADHKQQKAAEPEQTHDRGIDR